MVDQPVPTRTGRPSLQSGDFVVVSGGAEVTAAAVIALARRFPGRFLLLGRSETMDEPDWARGIQTDGELNPLMTALQQSGRRPHPREVGEQVARVRSSREILATLNAIRDAGAEARYAAVSVTDQEGLSNVIESLRQEWGPVRGLIHGAGVIADKHIRDKSSDDFQRVFDTKVLGLEALFQATASDPLKWIGLFSSVAARTGNQGQCDYAMANEVLNKVAQVEARNRPDCLVRSLGWGPWEGGMVQPQLKARFEAMGVPLIPIPVGAKMLVDEVSCADRGRSSWFWGGLPRNGPYWMSRVPTPSPSSKSWWTSRVIRIFAAMPLKERPWCQWCWLLNGFFGQRVKYNLVRSRWRSVNSRF